MNESNWFEAAIAAVMAALGWAFKRHVDRVDELERTSVKKADFDELADTTRVQLAELRNHMDTKFEAQTHRIFEMLNKR